MQHAPTPAPTVPPKSPINLGVTARAVKSFSMDHPAERFTVLSLHNRLLDDQRIMVTTTASAVAKAISTLVSEGILQRLPVSETGKKGNVLHLYRLATPKPTPPCTIALT